MAGKTKLPKEAKEKKVKDKGAKRKEKTPKSFGSGQYSDYITAKQFRKPDMEKRKKILFIILAVLVAVIILFTVLLSLVGNHDNDSVSDSAYSVSSREKNIVRGNGLVSITVPSEYLSIEPTEQLTDEQKALGFTVATVNDDNSVTYTMEEEAYKKYKESVEATTKNTFDRLSSNIESVKDVSFNSNMTKIRITVDRNAFEGSTDIFAIDNSFITLAYMQAIEGYAPVGIAASYIFIDESTGEDFRTLEYPEALGANS